MTSIKKEKAGRREFIQNATLGAAGIVGGSQAVNEETVHAHPHDHQVVPDDIALRVRALESVLVDKQMLDPAELDDVVDAYENRIGPRNGAQVVARAWTCLLYTSPSPRDRG